MPRTAAGRIFDRNIDLSIFEACFSKSIMVGALCLWLKVGGDGRVWRNCLDFDLFSLPKNEELPAAAAQQRQPAGAA